MHERQLAAAYRRPVIFGAALEQNAAVWYRRAFANVGETDSKTLRSLAVASNAGFQSDAADRQALLEGPCRQVQASAIRDALRCTHCDWELPYQLVQSASSELSTKPMLVSKCLTLEGHQRAASGDARGAMRLYLQTISLGCDLGIGDLVMNALGDMSVQTGLIALARLVGTTHDVAFLDEVSQQLAQFEGNLPYANTSVRFERLRMLTVVSVEERASSVVRLLLLPRAIAAWRLAQDERILNDIPKAESVSGGPEGLRLYEQMTQRVAEAPSSIVRTGDADRWILWLMSAEIGRQLYGAAQVAITLEKWRVTHGDYPQDAAALGFPLNAYGLSYRRTTDGYQLTAPRNRETKAVILEQPVHATMGQDGGK